MDNLERLIEVTLERAAKRSQAEPYRPPSAATLRKAAARRRVEELEERKAIMRECAEVWE